MCSIVWVRDLVMSYLAKCVFCFPIGVLPEWLPNYPPTRSWESSLSWCNSRLKSLFWFFPRTQLGFDSWDTFLHALLFLYVAGNLGGFAPCDLSSRVIPKCQPFVLLPHQTIATLLCARRRSPHLANSWLHSERHVNVAGWASTSDSVFTRLSLWLTEAQLKPREICYPLCFPKSLDAMVSRQFCLERTKWSGFAHW